MPKQKVINQPKNQSNISSLTNMDRVEIVFYTDPLCCWSWALLPGLLQLQSNFNKHVTMRYCMGGLIKDWTSFSDPLNNVSKPSQMGPIWMDACQKTGLDLNYRLWAEDPPSSSYPACIAVKTAALQSAEAEAAYFKLIAQAAMVTGKNIARPEVLVAIAQQLQKERPDIFDFDHFLKNYNNEESRNAFRENLQEVKSNGIGRFPTVTMAVPGKKKLMFTGYRSYEILVDALTSIAPSF